MIKREKLLWILYAGFLVLLFLLSSTNLIIKEREQEIYRLSVIIEDSMDDNYVNFRKGMDQAAMEQNADVSFITLYEKDNRKQQMELILREEQGGAGALVVSPVDENEVIQAISGGQIQVPLVLLNTELTGGEIEAVISPDYYEMGKLLAKKVAERHDSTLPVYLFGEPQDNRTSGRFEAGIRSVLEAQGYRLTLFERRNEQDYRRTIEELVYPGCRDAVIIALDPGSLSETAAILWDSSVYASYVKGLYGRGTTLSVLNDLDRGLIRGICVTDDFAAGYQSVQTAVDLMKNRRVQKQANLESYYIEKEDLRRPEYEKMLYPIE